MNEKIKKAMDFCVEKHEGQTRRYTKEPYATHPTTVATILKTLKNINESVSDDLIVAGLLHDILEDTKTTEEEIKKEFGENVLNLVKEVTHSGNIKSRDGLVLKLADMIANLYNIPIGVEDDDGLNEYLQNRIIEMNNMQKRLKDEKSLKDLVNYME